MRIPISWLGEFVDLPEDVTHEHVHAALVKGGLEEEDVHGFELSGPVVVGQVLEFTPEPQANGKTINWFGGSSNASTQLLDGMHYRGLLRIARREGGVRLYAAREAVPSPADPRAAHDALVDVVVAKYAPLPAASLGQLVSQGVVPIGRQRLVVLGPG